jgi:2-isopropylmalate synthase
MRAEDVGWNANKLTLGKLSGRNAFRTRLKELGIELDTDDLLNVAFAKFKDLADKKSEIFDEDLHALVSDDFVSEATESFKLVYLQVSSITGEVPHAIITVSENGVETRAEADGGGPVDAAFKAIETIVKSGAELQLYSVNNITSGTDAQGEVTVRLSKGGRIVNGQGADTDIVVASVKAYLNALNKIQSKSERAHPQV